MKRTNILQVDGLSVRYGVFKAVSDVSFSIGSGEIFGLLGPNGAGKTSTLSAIEGLVKPASGNISIGGYDVQQQALKAHACTGVQLQSTSFQPELPVQEIVRLYASLYGIRLGTQQLKQQLKEHGLEDAASKRIGKLSGGQQQRVSLLVATIHDPLLVILDEPTTGLDPQSRRRLWQRLEHLRNKGHAILLTTHSMEEAEAVCDRVAIMDGGMIIQMAAPHDLIDLYQENGGIQKMARAGKVTLEDVFIGLTGQTLRS